MPKFRVMCPGPWGDPGSVIEMSTEDFEALHLNATTQLLEPMPEDAELRLFPQGTFPADTPLDVLMRERRAESMFMMDQYRALVQERIRNYSASTFIPMFRDYVPEAPTGPVPVLSAAAEPEKMSIPKAMMDAITAEPNNMEAALAATETAMAVNAAFNAPEPSAQAPAEGPDEVGEDAEVMAAAVETVVASSEANTPAKAKAKATPKGK